MATTKHQTVSAIVVDEDTLRYGGSAFVRERTCRFSRSFIDPSKLNCLYQEYLCSECGEYCVAEVFDSVEEAPNYCPNCGAKVVG